MVALAISRSGPSQTFGWHVACALARCGVGKPSWNKGRFNRSWLHIGAVLSEIERCGETIVACDAAIKRGERLEIAGKLANVG